MTEYIIQGIMAILVVGISAGFLARRQRLRKEGKYPPKHTGPGIRQCDWADIRTIPYQELNPNLYSKHSTDSAGNQRWTNGRNQLHRTDGPAIIWNWGTKDWYINGKRHREDGPATEYNEGGASWALNGKVFLTEETWKKELNKPKCEADSYGNKFWHNKEGQNHREDGPAREHANGTKSWWINGKRHREDGPAIERPSDGTKEWYLNGHAYSEEKWKKELDKPICVTDTALNRRWYKGNKFHREDGPAIEYADGRKSWYLNGMYRTEEEWKQAVSKLARS